MSASRSFWRREWFPGATAVFVALAMIWLAGAPFELDRGVREALTLIEPRGHLARFPTRFRWSEVADALAYEVSVWRLQVGANPKAEGSLAPGWDTRELLFRQRGGKTTLELHFDSGMRPGSGLYRWEVRALGSRGRSLAAEVEFRVGSELDGQARPE